MVFKSKINKRIADTAAKVKDVQALRDFKAGVQPSTAGGMKSVMRAANRLNVGLEQFSTNSPARKRKR